jgi:hypothetical protein
MRMLRVSMCVCISVYLRIYVATYVLFCLRDLQQRCRCMVACTIDVARHVHAARQHVCMHHCLFTYLRGYLRVVLFTRLTTALPLHGCVYYRCSAPCACCASACVYASLSIYVFTRLPTCCSVYATYNSVAVAWLRVL